MAMLGERFPSTQFFVTGVLGPQANAHGPNEFPAPGLRRKADCVRCARARGSRQAGAKKLTD
jgi:hypothetical protein